MMSSLGVVRNPLLILLTSFFLLAAAQEGSRNVIVGDALPADDRNLTWRSPSGDFEFGFGRVPDQQVVVLLLRHWGACVAVAAAAASVATATCRAVPCFENQKTPIDLGLTYLHEECSTQIIHCDIKPQNILLDDSFTAKISDFGLAKLLINSKSHTLTGIRGTKGYAAPEWFRSTPITVKVDVYSFGVMLLEIICCRRCVELEMEEAAILTEWAYDCYSEGNLGKLVENDEEERNDMGRVEMLVKVAMWCVQDEPSQRPKMRTVTMMLEGALLVPAPPCPFLYSFKPKDSSIINPEFP
ncbi:hypothetical protein SLEP1_g50043 [Rubroshorea leprosula]|uniref:Protein kinase domain-containing protein n=1 Tax=Rubroshorea leprosula TaxID=152421 RepID=A0AAV5LYQ3_9ROSI|nr:hypothetical protein SLEP1_g50043 [Rubroshorea leprosula]